MSQRTNLLTPRQASTDRFRGFPRACQLTAVQEIGTRPGRRESEALVVSPTLGGLSFTLRPSGSFDALNDRFSRVQVVTVLGTLLSSLIIARSIVSLAFRASYSRSSTALIFIVRAVQARRRVIKAAWTE